MNIIYRLTQYSGKQVATTTYEPFQDDKLGGISGCLRPLQYFATVSEIFLILIQNKVNSPRTAKCTVSCDCRRITLLLNGCCQLFWQCMNDIRRVPWAQTVTVCTEPCPWLCMAQRNTKVIFVWELPWRLAVIQQHTILTVQCSCLKIFQFSPQTTISCGDTICNGSYAELIHLFALSKALELPIQSYCCPHDSTAFHPYTIFINQTCYKRTCKSGFATLMWKLSHALIHNQTILYCLCHTKIPPVCLLHNTFSIVFFSWDCAVTAADTKQQTGVVVEEVCGTDLTGELLDRYF